MSSTDDASAQESAEAHAALEARVTDVEVALAFDRRLLDELNAALTDANAEVRRLQLRVERLEKALENALQQFGEPPPNDRPPHY